MMRSIKLLVIHHSASPRSTTRNQIDSWHRDRGWLEIGYHWVIEADGTVISGRPISLEGAHVKGHNQNSWGLCVTGNNTDPGEAWSTAQKNQLAQFVRWFSTFFPTAAVCGHRDLPGTATECPGLDVRQLLRDLGAFTSGG